MSGALKVQGLEQFDAVVKGWLAAVEKQAEDAAVKLAKVAFNRVVEHSPQYSGDYAANWKVSFGTPDRTFRSFGFSGKHAVGDEPAVSRAKAAANWKGFKLGQQIFLSNSAVHYDPYPEHYAWKIQNEQIVFREENRGREQPTTAFYRATAPFRTLDKTALAALLMRAGV